jgi:large subunit ribosomal protein L25
VLEIDVTGFDVGESIHISAVKLPEGVKPTITDRDFTIATIAAPSALKSKGGDTTQASDEPASE